MQFKDWLRTHNIEHEDYGEEVHVEDILLRPFESELKSLFPFLVFEWEIIPTERIPD